MTVGNRVIRLRSSPKHISLAAMVVNVIPEIPAALLGLQGSSTRLESELPKRANQSAVHIICANPANSIAQSESSGKPVASLKSSRQNQGPGLAAEIGHETCDHDPEG